MWELQRMLIWKIWKNMAVVCDKYTNESVTLNGTLDNELLETAVDSECDKTVKEAN